MSIRAFLAKAVGTKRHPDPIVIERPEGFYLQGAEGWDEAFVPRVDGNADGVTFACPICGAATTTNPCWLCAAEAESYDAQAEAKATPVHDASTCKHCLRYSW